MQSSSESVLHYNEINMDQTSATSFVANKTIVAKAAVFNVFFSVGALQFAPGPVL